jgi:hypothetical protein
MPPLIGKQPPRCLQGGEKPAAAERIAGFTRCRRDNHIAKFVRSQQLPPIIALWRYYKNLAYKNLFIH